jgi:hypothetical protein
MNLASSLQVIVQHILTTPVKPPQHAHAYAYPNVPRKEKRYMQTQYNELIQRAKQVAQALEDA